MFDWVRPCHGVLPNVVTKSHLLGPLAARAPSSASHKPFGCMCGDALGYIIFVVLVVYTIRSFIFTEFGLYYFPFIRPKFPRGWFLTELSSFANIFMVVVVVTTRTPYIA
jgi:hypothetical protein